MVDGRGIPVATSREVEWTAHFRSVRHPRSLVADSSCRQPTAPHQPPWVRRSASEVSGAVVARAPRFRKTVGRGISGAERRSASNPAIQSIAPSGSTCTQTLEGHSPAGLEEDPITMATSCRPDAIDASSARRFRMCPGWRPTPRSRAACVSGTGGGACGAPSPRSGGSARA